MPNINMSPKKNPMPSQAPEVRAHNFLEVATGYTEEMAIDEALRCLSCKNMPCVAGCPVNIHIPEFIAKIKEGDFEGAYQVIASPPAFRPSAAASARRRPSASANASEVLRASRWASAVWSGLWPTGTMPTAPRSR